MSVLSSWPKGVDVAIDSGLVAADIDLFGLAQIVAQNAGGMVSIEDPQSHVLAYSASAAEAADQMRVMSILGREGPREYLAVLRKWGVFDRLRRTDEVIDVPAHEELNIKRRLVVSIRHPADGAVRAPRVLGAIWLQQGDRPFKPDAAEILRGASAIAARLISRSLDAPSTEALLVQGLFGEGGPVDVATVATALNLPTTGPAAVVGFALTATETAPATEPSALGNMLRLRASSFRNDSVTATLGDRVYVLLPSYRAAHAVTAWTRQLVEQLEAKRALALRAAIACPIDDLSGVASARREVDRVLDSTVATYPKGRVTTLAESRTAVLLGEILDLVGSRPELHDPRLRALSDYDLKHSASLRESVDIYLREHGDVRAAAAVLQVHPNTLRYRIRRVEEILGIDLTDPGDRLLLELQLALHRRAHGRERGSRSR
ncbi:putative CdaR family transcriptional regulator [Nocardia brasiliensis NBRC 14402]|nr:putative CdaR family transcriptional regulator [Nocardia brasiliensis NBRC 14402]SUB54244.1 carbohydrate diacid transcriptional activator CdaR [Nocardia brasiliensis]